MDKLTQVIEILLRNKGMSISSLLHLLLFSLLIFSFPQCKQQRPPEVIISVDLLPIAKETNIENKQNKTKSDKEDKLIEKPKAKEEPEKVIEEPKKPAEEKKPDPISETPKKEIKKIEKKKEEKPVIVKSKPAPKKEEKKKKKPKPKVSEYDALLKTLEESNVKSDVDEIVDKPSKGPHNIGKALSLSLRDSIKKQIEQCWSPPAGNKDAGKLQVLLDISFKQDGSVSSAKVVNNSRYSNDEMYRVAADAAVRAVYKCSPLQGLPIDQYSAWENIEFNFDPSDMIY